MKKLIIALIALSNLWGMLANAQDSTIQGTYRTVLIHEPKTAGAPTYYQLAAITLRTVNMSGSLKISASVRMIFGDRNSNEFLTYEYADVPMNILTRQISLRQDNNDVAFVGNIKNGEINGEWFASSVGKVGPFKASQSQDPTPPAGSLPTTTVTGHYKGFLQNTNPDSNLPEKMTMSLVTTQDQSTVGTEIKISGNVRMYLGDFGTNEYVETTLSQAQFNFYTRFLTIKTADYGLTFKGILDQGGTFKAEVFADGLGKVGIVELRTLK